MGIFSAVVDSIGGTFADQWKDIVVPKHFGELDLVVPGCRQASEDGRGSNRGLGNVLTNGSIIEVPENTVAVVFSQQGIENVITNPGGYVYQDGQPTVLDKNARDEVGVSKILLDEISRRIEYSGMTPDGKRIAYVNLRELRGIKFGTRGPMVYNDLYYGTDLEIHSYGTFSVQVTDPVRVIKGFVPANAGACSLDDLKTRQQLVAELLSSFLAALNSLSHDYRISQLPSQTNAVRRAIVEESDNAGTWPERFGLRLSGIAIEGIELSDDSRELVRRYAEKKMDVRAYEGVSQQTANIAAQQMIASGIQEKGLGDGGGMVFGMNLAGGLNPMNASMASQVTPAAPAPATEPNPTTQTDTIPSFDEKIERLKKLKALLDDGLLTQEEFAAAKKSLLKL